MDFESFGSLSRLTGPVFITEKIDGTNAQICISDDGAPITLKSGRVVPFLCGSRTRWVFPEADNHGFAKWAYDNAEALLQLGPGRHFGEWWGQKIQRGYGVSGRYFSLFNTGRWDAEQLAIAGIPALVVPLLWSGPFNTNEFDRIMAELRETGSHAAPHYMNPEGIVIYDSRSGATFKKTFDYDDTGKGKQKDEHGNTL